MCSCFFLRRRISFVIWDSCLYLVLSHYFDRKKCFYTTFDIQGSVLKNSLSWPTCLHASSSTKNDWSWRRLTTTTKNKERPPWLTTTIKKTDHEERLTTTTDHDMTLHHFDLWGRVRVQLLTYVLMSGCICTHLLTHESMIMCSFEHNFPLVHPMRRVSTKLYQLRDVTTCKFSLKDASLH